MALKREFARFDFRKLSSADQEQVRWRAIELVEAGATAKEAGKAVGVNGRFVMKWVRAYERGEAAFKREAGRSLAPRSNGPAFAQEKLAVRIKRLIVDRLPDSMKMPYALWTPEAVDQLVQRETGSDLTLAAANAYLQRWGFVEQNTAPLDDADLVRGWFEREFPAIVAEAKLRHAQIHWLQETVLSHETPQADGAQVGEGGPAGPATFFAVTMIAAVSSQGALRFMICDGPVDGAYLINFLRRLMRDVEQPICLILEDHPAHRESVVNEFIAARERIQLVYSPIQLSRPDSARRI